MAIGTINNLVNCDRCTFADSWGRGCKHGLMTPIVIWMMGGKQQCPNFKPKTSEQIEQQIQDLYHNGKETKQIQR